METHEAQEMLKFALERIRKESFVEGYAATDEECFGLLVSKFCEWNGLAILKIMGYALEDSNFHAINEKVQEWIEGVESGVL